MNGLVSGVRVCVQGTVSMMRERHTAGGVIRAENDATR